MRSIGYKSSELTLMMAAKARSKPFYSPHGIYLGDAVQCEIPDRRIERIMATIVRGLYSHERKQRLPDDCQFRMARHFFRWEINTIKDVMRGLYMHRPHLLADVFGCTYTIATEDSFSALANDAASDRPWIKRSRAS
jgi:hypothetical protein